MVKSKFDSERIIKWLLISISLIFLFCMLIMPLIVVITESLKNGIENYKDALIDKYTIKALILTLEATVAAVVINTIFGLFAAWVITKFKFKGKKLLTTLIDIPFALSPIIAGLIFTLTFGRMGWTNGFLRVMDVKIVFAVPGIILATVFVTFPFVAREIIPVLNSEGRDEEEAAALMGASGLKIFFYITLPHIKWALLYGIILCTARAMGEFGAVSVISGHLKGKTETLPLYIESLYNEYNSSAAFAVASILVILAIVILVIKNIAENKGGKSLKKRI